MVRGLILRAAGLPLLWPALFIPVAVLPLAWRVVLFGESVAKPPNLILIEAVAGLALLGSFGGALMGAVREDKDREAAVICFLIAASGVAFLGVGGAFWGLLAGGAMLALSRWRG